MGLVHAAAFAGPERLDLRDDPTPELVPGASERERGVGVQALEAARARRAADARGQLRAKTALLGAIELSTSTFGAGMIVGARIGIAALVGGLVGWAMIPYFVSIGWLKGNRIRVKALSHTEQFDKRQELIVQLERSRHRSGIRLPQARRVLDVGQQEGDHPRRQIASVSDPKWSGRRGERRVLRQYRSLKFPQTLAGLDPQLFDPGAARVLVGLERIGLALAPVQRKHQLGTQALAIGMLADQRLEPPD